MTYRTLLALLVLVPGISHGQIVLSEVAWMGTSVGPNEEWIELFNAGDSAVLLDGWTLSDGVSLTIPLAGTVGAGEFAVLERTDDDTVSGTAFLIYTGALSNGGGSLTLARADGTIEDYVDGGASWEYIGGNNLTKETAQRTSEGWVTGVSTPGTFTVDTAGTENREEESDGLSNTSHNTTRGKTVSALGGSAKKTEVKIPDVLTLSIQAPKTVYVNQSVLFAAVPEGIGETLMHSLRYAWNFGDTYIGDGKDVEHTFAFPGEYVVVVQGGFAKQKALARFEITVLPTALALSRTDAGDILIKNNGRHEVDLGDFSLRAGSMLQFPKFTFIRPGKTLTISGARIMLGTQAAVLADQSGTIVAMTLVPHTNTVPYARTAVGEKSVPTKETNSPQANTPSTGVSQVTQSPESLITIGQVSRVEEAKQGIFRKIVGGFLGFFGL